MTKSHPNQTFNVGDEIEWNYPGGKTAGRVVKTITSNETVEVGVHSNREVKASTNAPRILVKSEKSGKRAVHKPEEIEKRS